MDFLMSDPNYLNSIVVLGCAMIAGCSTIPTVYVLTPSAEFQTSIEIAPQDRECQSDDESTLIWTKYSACDCGTAINTRHAERYEAFFVATCSNDRGPVCEIHCPEVVLKCVQSECLAVPAPPPTEET